MQLEYPVLCQLDRMIYSPPPPQKKKKKTEKKNLTLYQNELIICMMKF